MKRKSHAFR